MRKVAFIVLMLIAASLHAQTRSCDAKTGEAKQKWGQMPHAWLADVLHKERIELAQTWCHVGETEGYDKILKSEDFGRVLFTGEGLHPSAGTIVPGSGTAFGGVFNLERGLATHPLRFTGSVESRVSLQQFWVAGGKLDIVGSANRRENRHNYATIDVRHQHMPELTYYGIGPDTSRADRTGYGLDATTASFVFHFPIPHGFSLFARTGFVSASPKSTTDSEVLPSELHFTPLDTPALSIQTSYGVIGGGIEWKHPVQERLRGYRSNASISLQDFHSLNGKPYSFRRFSAAWSNDWTLGDSDKLGSISAGAVLIESIATSGNSVAFYMQPTIGGTSIENQISLPSYQDYRFRAPHTLMLGAGYDHKIYDPIGAFVAFDAGRVAISRGDLGLSHLHHSTAVGLTLKAGGRIIIRASYSWGDSEGSHAIFGGNSNPFALTDELRGVF